MPETLGPFGVDLKAGVAHNHTSDVLLMVDLFAWEPDEPGVHLHHAVVAPGTHLDGLPFHMLRKGTYFLTLSYASPDQNVMRCLGTVVFRVKRKGHERARFKALWAVQDA